jgi:cobalt-zinc-cadmium efflux system protein
VIMLTGWLWVDPVTSLIVAALVLVSGWGLARDSVNLALDAVPAHIDFADVRDYLAGLDGVSDVHDLHIWAMSTSETAMTVPLVRPGGFDDVFLHGLCEELSHLFRIQHPTIQIEASHETCRLAPADVV